MPSVSDILMIQLGIDASGLELGQQQAERALESTTRNLERQGNALETVVRDVGGGIETLVRNVAGLFGLVLGFEGFKKLVTDAVSAGNSMGRFAESIGRTVEETSLYEQAFRAASGSDTGISKAARQITSDLTRMQQGLQPGPTEYMLRWGQLGIAPPRFGEDPWEKILEVSRAISKLNIPQTAKEAAAESYFPGVGLTPNDLVLLTKPNELAEAIRKSHEVGVPTTAQAQAMERLQSDFSRLWDAATNLAIEITARLEPVIHDAITALTGLLVRLQNLFGGGAKNTNTFEERFGEWPSAQPKTSGSAPAASRPASTPSQPAPSSSITPAAPRTSSTSESAAPSKPGPVTLFRQGASSAAVDDALKLQGLNERRDRSTIIEYLRTGGAGMDPATTAWCAAFVNASLQREGIRGSGSAVATSFLRWGTPVTGKPQKGDVLVEARGRGPGQTGGHVGFATGETRWGPSGREYEMLAGNTGPHADTVQRTWVSASRVQVRRAREETAEKNYTPVPPRASVPSVTAPSAEPSTVPASMFNDRITASGKSAATTEGIALPSGGKFGDMYEITLPDGRKFVAPLIDRGPAKWTGRGVDISAPLAERMYGKDFPTDTKFDIRPLPKAEAVTAPQPTSVPSVPRSLIRLPDVDTGAAAAAKTSAPLQPKNIVNESVTSINKVEVHSHALDPAGIAKDVRDAIGEHFTMPEGQ